MGAKKTIKICTTSDLGKYNEEVSLEKANEQHRMKSIYTFEEAAALTGTGIYHYFLFIVIGLSMSVVVAEGLSMSVVIPSIQCEFSLTNAQQGAINAAGFTGIVFTSHFWGFLADTWGRRNVLIVALLTTFCSSLLSSISLGFEMLLVTRLTVGLCVAGVQAAGISYLGEFHSNQTRTKHVTYASMFMPLALIYVPIMAWIILPMNFKTSLYGLQIRPWRLNVMCLSLISAITFVFMVFLPESPKFMLALGRKNDALNILQTVYMRNTRKTKESFPVKELSLEAVGMDILEIKGLRNKLKLLWDQTLPIFKSPNLENIIILSFLIFVLFAIAHGIYMWLPMILTLYYKSINSSMTVCESISLGLQNATSVGTDDRNVCIDTTDPWTYELTVLIGIAIVGSYMVTAFLMRYIEQHWLISTWILMAGLCGICIVFARNFYLIVILLIAFENTGNCGSILVAITADLFPTNHKAMALCFIMMAGRTGAAIGSSFVGFLVDNYCELIFFIEGGFMIVSCGVCWYILKKCERIISQN